MAPTRRHFGRNAHRPNVPDTSPLLPKERKTRIQQIVGSFLFYGRALDGTTQHVLNDMGSTQSKPTINTENKSNHFLDYMSTHSDAKIQYYASDMILNVHSDVLYLTASRGSIRAAGHYFLGSDPKNGQPIKLNGAIHVLCSILKLVAASAAKGELGILFINAQLTRIIRLILEEMGHPQPPTLMHVDNTTVIGIVNNTIKQQ